MSDSEAPSGGQRSPLPPSDGLGFVPHSNPVQQRGEEVNRQVAVSSIPGGYLDD